MNRREQERHVRRVLREQRRLQPLLPEVDPHDLNLILSRMLRPVEDRRYFVRKVRGRYVR